MVLVVRGPSTVPLLERGTPPAPERNATRDEGVVGQRELGRGCVGSCTKTSSGCQVRRRGRVSARAAGFTKKLGDFPKSLRISFSDASTAAASQERGGGERRTFRGLARGYRRSGALSAHNVCGGESQLLLRVCSVARAQGEGDDRERRGLETGTHIVAWEEGRSYSVPFEKEDARALERRTRGCRRV